MPSSVKDNVLKAICVRSYPDKMAAQEVRSVITNPLGWALKQEGVIARLMELNELRFHSVHCLPPPIMKTTLPNSSLSDFRGQKQRWIKTLPSMTLSREHSLVPCNNISYLLGLQPIVTRGLLTYAHTSRLYEPSCPDPLHR